MMITRIFLRHTLLFLLLLTGLSASAQITDNFSDGDFTTNPAWSGDNSVYIVNASGQLQLNATVADTSFLSFPSPFIANAEWQFWVRLNFAPSNNNFARIYLVSDVANLVGPVNGYYVRLGENGSFDSVDLWEQSGTTSTKIIDGVNNHCAATNNILRIRVTRDAAGNWNMYSDTTGGVNFQPEGSTFDATHTSCNYFGVCSQYTVSNITKFYYDDFYVGPVIVDTTPPALVSATATGANTLDVLFNENVDATTSQTASNYSVNNSIGSPTTAVRDASNHSLVHLTFATNFVSAQSYVLTVTNVQDLNTNAITSATANFSYFPLSTPGYHDVVINEIMADPSPQVGLPNTEFVELLNITANNFDLSGWAFTDGASSGALGNYILPANSYVILCANADTALFSPFGAVVGLSSFPSLNNSGDNLKILDAASNVIDSVSYDISWYQDANKQNGGWTLELINPGYNFSCAPYGNWKASVAGIGGTPGTQNSIYNTTPDNTAPFPVAAYASDSVHVTICFSEPINPAALTNANNYSGLGTIISAVPDSMTYSCVTLTLTTPLANDVTQTVSFAALADCNSNFASPSTANVVYHIVQPFDVVINEIMADPDPPVLLPNEEYFELHNTTTFPLNLDSWSITVGTTTRPLPPITLPPDSFVVLTSTSAAALFSGINVTGVTSFPALTNTGATITLRAKSGVLVHSVSYSDAWYQNAVKASGGWSLEMIDPNNPCAGASNWKASNSNAGGTPGRRNSVYASNPDVTAPHLVHAYVITSDSIRLFFSEPLDSVTMANVTRYSIDNSIGNPLAVKPIAPDFTKCDLKLSTTLQQNITYTLSVNTQVSDCAGNAMNSSATAIFALPQPIAANDVVINEVLFDPKDGGTDFVEIYNRSQKVIDLKTLLLCSQDTIANTLTELNVIAPEGYLLFPGEYLVLSESSAAVEMQYPNNIRPDRCLQMVNIPAMNVDGDIVVLADTGFRVIDKLVYSSSWHFPLLQDTKGVSLERIDFERPTQDATNWHSAAETAGFATPTQKNSEYNPGVVDDGAVSIGEQIFSPDGDGFNDVLNISYHFTEPGYTASILIYDSRGRLVRTLVQSEMLGTESGTFSWDGTMDDRTKARVGAYVVYFEAFQVNGNVKRYKRACVLAGKM